jgi:hypothetical protein
MPALVRLTIIRSFIEEAAERLFVHRVPRTDTVAATIEANEMNAAGSLDATGKTMGGY